MRAFFAGFPLICPQFLPLPVKKVWFFFGFFQKNRVFSQKKCVFGAFLLDNYLRFMVKYSYQFEGVAAPSVPKICPPARLLPGAPPQPKKGVS